MRPAPRADSAAVGNFQRIYSDEQRAAIAQAWADRGVRSARTLVALAAAGELTLDGELVAAFKVTEASARRIGEKAVRTRERTARRAQALAPGDATEQLRRTLAATIDEQLRYIGGLQARRQHGKVSGEQLRQLARAIRELEATPAPGRTSADVPASPSEHRDGKRPDGSARGGLADKLRATLAPARIEPVQDEPVTYIRGETPGDDETTRATPRTRATPTDDETTTDDTTTATDDDEPGQYARDAIAALSARQMTVRSR